MTHLTQGGFMTRASTVAAIGAFCLAGWVALAAAQTPQPKPPAKPPAAKPADAAAMAKAEENYAKVCQLCHGPKGKSPMPGMSLVDREWKHGTSTAQIVKTITEGVPGTAMLPNKDKFTKEEILALARLVRSFDPSLKPEKK
jgi:mono/diheme cytochrome c family protein